MWRLKMNVLEVLNMKLNEEEKKCFVKEVFESDTESGTVRRVLLELLEDAFERGQNSMVEE
jgi:hypothetical protein